MGSKYKNQDNGSSNLLKIGHEAFGMLEEEENFGRKLFRNHQRRPNRPTCVYQYQPQKPVVLYQMMNPAVSSSTQEKVTSYDASKLHDGLLIRDYSKRKSAAMAY